MKDTKEVAQYTPHAMRHSERCAVCKYYRRLNALEGDCDKVIGVVKGAGWCKHFQAR